MAKPGTSTSSWCSRDLLGPHHWYVDTVGGGHGSERHQLTDQRGRRLGRRKRAVVGLEKGSEQQAQGGGAGRGRGGGELETDGGS